MATTTNYGWTTPNDTDLVKDGAAAIRTLGSSVDTTTKALNPSTTLGDIEYRSATANTNTRLGIGSTGNVLTVTGGVPVWAAPAIPPSGLTLVSATAYTSQTTVSINSVFSSTYANYLIVMDTINTGAVTSDVSFKLRASGSDTSANYKSQRLFATVTTTGAGVDVLGTDEIYFGSAPQTGNPPLTTHFVLTSPNEAKRTTMQGSMAYAVFNSGNPIIEIISGSQSDTTQFDGITFLFSATNTGNIYIYGLAKA
jgi:hypothetical protein